jgi:hypothetical protein
MTAAPADARPNGNDVTTVQVSTGTMAFDRSLEHVEIGSGWASWSHGYTGDVYHTARLTGTQRDSLTMTLPAGTRAFYFYVEPDNTVGTYSITASSGGTSSGPVDVAGASGARYFGFFCSSGNDFITTVTVTAASAAGGFAVGEFGTAGDQLLGSVPCAVPVDLPPSVTPGPSSPAGAGTGSNTGLGAVPVLPAAEPVLRVPTFTG